MRIGLISDTHGLLRPEAVDALRGCDHIVHGGDICGAHVLEALGDIAPVTAVRGNNDIGPWAAAIPERATVQLGPIRLHVLHDLADLDIDPAKEGVRVVVTGHSHKPVVAERGGVLYVNPGSAGPRRFKLPIALAELAVEGDSLKARIIELNVGKPA
jgi:putative phosphoesterase